MSFPPLLIVDDNPADVALAREALAECAHCGEVVSVEDGEQAVAFLRRQEKYAQAETPGLVILDLNLPKKDGRTVLAEVKADPELRHIPIVVFSTSRLNQDIGGCYQLGANCYVNKPGNLADFFLAMKSIKQFWFGSVSLPPRGE